MRGEVSLNLVRMIGEQEPPFSLSKNKQTNNEGQGLRKKTKQLKKQQSYQRKKKRFQKNCSFVVTKMKKYGNPLKVVMKLKVVLETFTFLIEKRR